MQRLHLDSLSKLSNLNQESVIILVETPDGIIKVGRINNSFRKPFDTIGIEFDGKTHLYNTDMSLEQFKEKLVIMVPDNYFDIIREQKAEIAQANADFASSFPSRDDYEHYLESLLD